MAFSSQELTHIALDLTAGISNQDRFQRLLNTIKQALNCDASALLAFQGQQFTPLATSGLSADVLGRRFVLNEHPRLEAIARAGDIVRFPADSQLPDPYDGLIPNQEDELKVHACIGLPLMAGQRLIGALTIDGFDPQLFDGFSDDELRTVSALAAASLNNALMMEKLEQYASKFQVSEPSVEVSDDTEMIGQSAGMKTLKNEIDVVANSDLNVLILGDTGVGKELVAKAIHTKSLRANKNLVYLNCAALPESVAESELFGHVKGAFTGAINNRSGKFELADKGTLFLDEIGELPLSLQAKLLRVLQYGDLQRIGDDNSLKVDVRIVAATNKDLKTEVMEKRFRADLYHRLSVFPIQVPSLQEREGDIALLAGFFIERCRAKLGLQSLRLSQTSLALLSQYAWPGNVRELEHAIHRAAILARAEHGSDATLISPHHFEIKGVAPVSTATSPAQLEPEIKGESLRDATELFQQHYIRQTLDTNQGNWAATARQLVLDSGNLHRLAKRLGLK